KSNVVFVAKSVGGKAPPASRQRPPALNAMQLSVICLVGSSLSYEGLAKSSGRLYRPREERKPFGMLSPPPQYGGQRYRLPVRDRKQAQTSSGCSDRASHGCAGASFS